MRNSSIGKRICILEDNKDIREIIELVLHEENYQVFAFGNVRDFWNGALRLQPDAYLLDVMLPDGNGIEVCCELKKDKLTQNTPVLMMSANFSGEEKNVQCGAADYINKPFDIFDLAKRISAQLA